MLAANITIKNINYEKTLEGIFPLLKENFASVDPENEHLIQAAISELTKFLKN